MNRKTIFNTRPDADHFVGLLKIWNVVKSYDSVIKYANSLGFDEDEILDGYVYFIDTWLIAFLDEIVNSEYIPLEDNYELYRAKHQGVHISKMSNSCDKILFIRNYHKLMRRLKKSTKHNVKSIMNEFDDFISKFEAKFNEVIRENDGLSLTKKDRFQFVTILRVLDLFNQMIKRIPAGRLLFTLFKNYVTLKELEKNFLGYKITLLYMWKKCLNERQFEVIKELKNTVYWGKDIVHKEHFSGKTIDCFFRKIVDEIIEPLKKQKNKDLNIHIYFLFKKRMPKHLFNVFLEDISPQLTEQEKIHELFLWYNSEVIDSAKMNTFNGAMAFIILLEGSASLKKLSGKKDPVQVLRILHKAEHGHDYSYGILIELGGIVSDYSGWMVFYDVCGDYSGFSGMQHTHIESRIKFHLKRKSIEIREKEMSLETLKKHLLKKITYRSISQDKKQYKDTNEKLSQAKGALFELLVYYLQTQAKGNSVKWGVEVEKGEIDVLIETKDSIRIIECKLDPNNYYFNLDDEIKKIKKKRETYKSLKHKTAEFWFWDKISLNIKKKLESQKIGCIIVPEQLKNLPDFQKTHKRVSSILDYKNQSNRYYFYD